MYKDTNYAVASAFALVVFLALASTGAATSAGVVVTYTTVLRYFLPSNLTHFFFLKATIPSTRAWIEKSLPLYVFSPSSYLSPFCLIIMFPATTGCAPNTLTHLYFAFESLRFLAEPAAFLCAIVGM